MTPLPPDRWPEIERLFAATAGATPDEAEARLAGADPAVAAEVRALLDADRAADDAPPLSTLLEEIGFAPEAPADDLAPGTRVGAWIVEDEIGAGGMGVVYRASRADGLPQRPVALKVVRRGMDSAAVVRRFAQERAVLAGLDHPGIARVVDGGTAPDGRPFFAMDLVDGEPITRWADRRQLGVDERLRLFLQVCDAVAHAHRRLVVHRDLKPSNVFVADTDAGPRVSLLDFGVARLLDDTGSGVDGGALTRTGDARPLTPAYAAPEQLAGGAVTTATDVYALGVLLSELLAGFRPRASADRWAALSRSVRDTGATGATGADVAAARGTTPERLRLRLRGDLDAIASKALRPEPEARYATVDALADDLRRHLDGLPVAARDGSARYVAGRFVRRHRWTVAAAAVAALVLIAVTTLVTVQNRRITRERDRAERIASVLESLFLDVDPGGPRGAATDLRGVLDAGAARVEALDDAPEAQAHLLDVVARVYRALADYDRALPLHRAAVATATRAHGADAPETLLARHHLAYLLAQMGRTDEAERTYRAVLAVRRRSGDPDGLVESLSDLSDLRLGLGDTQGAAALAREGLAVLRRHPDAGPPDLEGPLSRAGFLATLARADEAAGRLDAAERGLRESAAIYARERSADHTYTAAAEASLAAFLARRGQAAEADRLLRHAVDVQTAAWGPDHPWTTATLSARAEARARAGDARTARALLADVRARVAADSARSADLDRRTRLVDSLLAGRGVR